MCHHQANLEPLNIFEFLIKVIFVSKAADPCVSSGWPSIVKSNYLLYLLCWLKINELKHEDSTFFYRVCSCFLYNSYNKCWLFLLYHLPWILVMVPDCSAWSTNWNFIYWLILMNASFQRVCIPLSNLNRPFLVLSLITLERTFQYNFDFFSNVCSVLKVSSSNRHISASSVVVLTIS
jgi:hypothetical protein